MFLINYPRHSSTAIRVAWKSAASFHLLRSTTTHKWALLQRSQLNTYVWDPLAKSKPMSSDRKTAKTMQRMETHESRMWVKIQEQFMERYQMLAILLCVAAATEINSCGICLLTCKTNKPEIGFLEKYTVLQSLRGSVLPSLSLSK